MKRMTTHYRYDAGDDGIGFEIGVIPAEGTRSVTLIGQFIVQEPCRDVANER